MTAPEPTPTAEHIDAVARALSLDPGAFSESTYGAGGARVMASRFAAIDRARKLLASTDPDVHAALAANLPAEVMLAALVRAGVLTEDRERLVRACGCIANEEPAACCDPLASPHWERRYVTSWQVAP